NVSEPQADSLHGFAARESVGLREHDGYRQDFSGETFTRIAGPGELVSLGNTACIQVPPACDGQAGATNLRTQRLLALPGRIPQFYYAEHGRDSDRGTQI